MLSGPAVVWTNLTGELWNFSTDPASRAAAAFEEALARHVTAYHRSAALMAVAGVALLWTKPLFLRRFPKVLGVPTDRWVDIAVMVCLLAVLWHNPALLEIGG